MGFQLRKFDATLERRIIIGMIVSAEFLAEASVLFRADLFRVPALRKVAQWCVSYWNEFGKAPGTHIQDIYESNRRTANIPDEQAQEIEDLLSSLSNEYITNPNLNVQYLLRQMDSLLRSRALLALGEDLVSLASNEDVTNAELALANFQPVQRDSVQWSDPFRLSTEQMESIFSEGDVLFRMPGALGELMGPVERDGFIGVQAPEKRGKCLAAKSKVILATGELRTIQEIVEDLCSPVVSMDVSTGRFVKSPVSEHWYNGIKSVYRLTTKTGRTIDATDNEPFFTPDGWSDLRDLNKGEFIAVPKELPFFGTKKIEPYLVRMFAYFIADGGLTSKCPTFTKTNPELQNDFAECIAHFGCRVSWNGISGSVVNSDENRHKRGKNHVCTVLEKHGLLGKLSKEKTIPDIIFQSNKQGVALFLRTLFSCDGWMSSTGADIGYGSASKELAKQVQHLLVRFGIVSKISHKPNNCAGLWSVEIRDYQNMRRYVERIGFLFSKQQEAEAILRERPCANKSFLDKVPWKIGERFLQHLRIECKQKHQPLYATYGRNKIKNLSTQIGKQKPLMWQSFVGMEKSDSYKKFFDNQILWDEIINISYIGEDHTYDLTIPKHHNFVAENIVVHNTWYLWEFALRGVLNRCNVAFFSVGDMSARQNWRRVYGWVLRSSKKRAGRKALMPVLDCRMNQLGECRDAPDQESVMKQEGELLSFDDYTDHEPCVQCLRQEPARFIGSRWYRREVVPPFNLAKAQQMLNNISRRCGGKTIRLSCFPSYQANVRTIKTMLDLWEKRDGWVADVVIIDYADILAPEDSRETETRHKINNTWSALRGLSTERSIAVITATQAGRASYSKMQQDMTDVSEDKRKLGHVTSMLGLNQTPEEKRAGLMRVNQLVVREDESDIRENVVCLQCLSMSRPLLGSYWLK